jgi:hypothetical protein
MRRPGLAAALLGLLVAVPAAARPSEAEYEAWSVEYGDRYDRWYFTLLFDRDLYFHDGWSPGREAQPTTNLVDAHYSIALRRFGAGWAFAVEMDCPARAAGTAPDPNACRPLLRIVSAKPKDSPPPAWLENFLPKSREEVARVLEATFDWREADLRECTAALRQLTDFPKVAAAIWPQPYLDWLGGGEVAASDTIAVTADGDAVSLRAAARDDPSFPHGLAGQTGYSAEQYNGGAAYDWAIALHDAVEPCLKPAAAPAPWSKALARPDVASPQPGEE